MSHPLTRDQAVAVIRNSAVAAFAEPIIAAMAPSVRLIRERIDQADVAIGASRFGGDPDLPNSVDWPTWSFVKPVGILRRKTTRTAPLDFLAQIDCGALPADAVPPDFPTTGMLYAFYAASEQPWDIAPGDRDGGMRILYAPSDHALVRTAPPAGASSFAPCRIDAVTAWTVPEGTIPAIDPNDEALCEAYLEEVCVAVNGDPNSVIHRLFGHGQWIQSEGCDEDAEDEARLRLLLQIDSDDGPNGPGWMWGDAGRLYVMITDADLAKRRFGEVQCTLECY